MTRSPIELFWTAKNMMIFFRQHYFPKELFTGPGHTETVTHIRVRMFPGIIIVIIVINTKMSPKSSSSAQIISQMSHISKLFILFHTLLGQHIGS